MVNPYGRLDTKEVVKMDLNKLIEKGSRITLEPLDETETWATGANFAFKTALPRDRDIIALAVRAELNVDSGTSVTKTAIYDRICQAIAELKVKLDGQPIFDLYDMELKWLHWFVWGQKPYIKETPDAVSQAGQTAFIRFMLPLLLPASTKPGGRVTVNGKWGATAELDAGTGFVWNSGTLYLETYKGRLNALQKKLGFYYTRRHEPTSISGVDEQFVPSGLLKAIIAQITDRSDSLDTCDLVHGGHHFLNNTAYEELVNYMKWKWGITLEEDPVSGEADAEVTSGLVIVDGHNLPSNGVNTKFHYKTTASKDLYIQYLLRGRSLTNK